MTTSSDTLRAFADRFDRVPSTRRSVERGLRRTLPSARHLELDCGHLPQVEHPFKTHAATVEFLRADLVDDHRPGPVSDAFG
jgi:pimeloyl-ACP methyl ester carboxylesterase